MEIVPVLRGLNLYNPSDEHLLLVAKARVIKWGARGGPKCYLKKSIVGPILVGEDILVYEMKLDESKEISFSEEVQFVEIPAWPKPLTQS